MRTNKPVLVYVGNDDRATDFMEASGSYVLGAPTLRDALAQTIFSFPDAIVLDASEENMLLAEDAFFHLRTINHPPVLVLSDMPGRWDTTGTRTVVIVPNDTHPADALTSLREAIAGSPELVR